ncbi:hypothetical protein AKJ38_01375 [candidate division MSBL1 archaeon SCGC-AAA259I14]|uniref:DUF1284 domain-containing protein n=3 Tax=candidate division MSBL1 TaxID=215777 RepID=A0A133UT07_9EURY|nr:hypothetical protein AKJ66_00575 [candidate division MSBL1 archaeon SCGC-AAA259E22]KXA95247.1 hypothetical protein AKJ36_01205 [candidate division MSBL1 archaeon SCGC-AAA259I07]KXA97371.1 hypothetical protein AKJ38_01375 [candidate division MSBL1 archaeon SCGC-AAA259I14]
MLELRPHHIFCPFFTDFESPDREEEFQQVTQRLRKKLRGENNLRVKFIKGPDQICKPCTHYDAERDRCDHPRGDEEEVQKWDHNILKGLNLEVGNSKKLTALKELIREKHPLDFCIEKCPYKKADLCEPADSNYL